MPISDQAFWALPLVRSRLGVLSNAAVLARFLGKARLLTPAACALAVERARVRCALSRALVHARAFRCLCS